MIGCFQHTPWTEVAPLCSEVSMEYQTGLLFTPGQPFEIMLLGEGPEYSIDEPPRSKRVEHTDNKNNELWAYTYSMIYYIIIYTI